LILLLIYPEVLQLGWCAFNFLRNLHTDFQVAALIYIPSSSVQVISPTSLPKFVVYYFLDGAHSNEGWMGCYCTFDLYFLAS
jgi:hypothetical protein